MDQTAGNMLASRGVPQADFKQLQRLRQACRLAFERFVDIASHGSGELIRLSPANINQVSRLNVALLQQKEQKAYEAYLRARTNLMEFVLQSDNTIDVAEGIPAPSGMQAASGR